MGRERARDAADDQRPHQRLRAPDARSTPAARSAAPSSGADNRLNNITVDGSYFNNSFGLAGQPGDRTGVAPISMAADRGDPGERRALRRAPGQLRRRRRQHRHAQRRQRLPRLGLLLVPRRRAWSAPRPRALPFNPGTFDFDKWGGWLSRAPSSRTSCSSSCSFEDEELDAAGDDVPRQRRRPDRRRQHDARARLRPERPEQLPEQQLPVRHRPLSRTTTTRRRPGATWPSWTTT